LIVIVAPIFSAFVLYYVQFKATGKTIPFVLITLFMVLAMINFYNCQPLIPAASSIDATLPDDEPLVYINDVNTVYQREMIAFAETYLPGETRIASDITTSRQLVSLTPQSFSQQYIYYYPLSDESPREFDVFLIHQPGKAGGFGGADKAEERTAHLILNYMNQANIIYTNSESYILLPPYTG
jgi:hypothetical protein